MAKKAGKDSFDKGGTEEEQQKKSKKLTVLIGCVLLLTAILVYGLKSDYVRNQLAMLGSAEDYYVYVEMKNLAPVNAYLTESYQKKEEAYKKDSSMYSAASVSMSLKCGKLLDTLLSLRGVPSEAAGTLQFVRENGKTALTGDIFYGKEKAELAVWYDTVEGALLFQLPEKETCYRLDTGKGEFSLTELLASGKLKGSKVKKLLEKYERLFFENGIGMTTLKKDVLCEVNGHAVYRTELIRVYDNGQLEQMVRAVLQEAQKEKQLKKAYEAAALTEYTYEEWLEKIFVVLFDKTENSSTTVEEIRETLYIDSSGKVTGRDVVIKTSGDVASSGQASFGHMKYEHAQNEHTQNEYVQTGHIQLEHAQTEHVQTEHVQTEHVQTEYALTEHAQGVHAHSGHEYRIGYNLVKSGLSIGLEAYYCVDGEEQFLADGVLKTEKSALGGEMTVSIGAGDQRKTFDIAMGGVQILDLAAGRLAGNIKITSDLFRGADVLLSLEASSQSQKYELYLLYGGTEQLTLELYVEQEGTRIPLPTVPPVSMPFPGISVDGKLFERIFQ